MFEYSRQYSQPAQDGWRAITCTSCHLKRWVGPFSCEQTTHNWCDSCVKPPPLPPPPPLLPSVSMHAQPTFDVPSAAVSSELGLSLCDFRELQLLQTREIGPEDYDLLMMLSAKANTKVLDNVQLSRAYTPFQSEEEHAAPCAICLEPMPKGGQLARLCCDGGHVFHSGCIREWLTTASTCCPVDKQDLSNV